MSVSRSIICASNSTARAMPSMRPASSSKSVLSMLISRGLVAMTELCAQKLKNRISSPAICLEARFGTTQRSHT